jgi:predicted Zn finger-like uncharacterized protein
MKIVCDSCGTKYSIADEKVRGKVFKIRCKKCSHIIVVRGGETGGPEATAAPATEGGWHLVIDGEQVGPIGDADVRTKIERGEVKGDTYTWKEGFADWVKLSAVPEFAALVAEDVGGVAAGGGELFPSGAVAVAAANGTDRARRASGAGRSLFGGGGASDVFAASASPARSEGGGLFGSAAAAPASEESRWPSSGAAAAGHDGGRVESLTGQRHENSVLFSLSNLQSLAMPAAKPASTSASSSPLTEGSGLIDIRQMAASTLGASSGGGSPSFGGNSSGGVDDLPAFGAFSPAAPVLLPLSSNSGPPKWVYVALVLGLAAVGGIALMAYKVLTTKSPVLVEQVQQVAAPQEPAKPAPAGTAAAPGGKPSTIAEENLPPREGSSEAKAGDKGEKSEKAEHGEHEHHHGGKGKEAKKGSGGGGDEKKGAAAVVATNSEPAEKKPAKGSLDDLIDGAVGSRHGGSGRPKVSDDDKPAVSAGPLAKGAVVAGMNSVKPKIAACYSEFKVQGMAMVNVVIGKSGKVSSATVSGKFAGTPTGACVEKAVKSASFPPSDGLQTPYPFQLK